MICQGVEYTSIFCIPSSTAGHRNEFYVFAVVNHAEVNPGHLSVIFPSLHFIFSVCQPSSEIAEELTYSIP